MELSNKKEFQKILNDRTHGSTYLAKKYLKFIINFQVVPKQYKKLYNKIKNTFPDMMIFTNIDEEITKEKKIVTAARDILEQIEKSSKLISDNLLPEISPNSNFATFSYSQTVLEVIKILTLKNLYFFKSEPGGEGEKFANQFETGQLVSDPKGIELIKENVIGTVLIGCDSYNQNKGIINKVGTLNLIETCAQNDQRVFVLTSKYKFQKQLPDKMNDEFEFIPIMKNMKIVNEEEII